MRCRKVFDGVCTEILDCAGVCGGTAEDAGCGCEQAAPDECGVCFGDNSTCTDCAGEVNGNATEDNCGVCDHDGSNDCVQDCEGEWGGTVEVDGCGVCDGNNSTCADCAGTPNGDAAEDNCGVCDDDDSNDCEQDCAFVWGGDASELTYYYNIQFLLLHLIHHHLHVSSMLIH
jgi:hypothetical protein